MMVPAGGAALWREQMARIAGPRVGTYLFTEAEVDALCARVWREAQAAWIEEDDQRWIKVIEGRASRLERAEARADRLAAALRRLVTMIDRHREIYDHEKAHYVIDENEEWREARAALADSPKEE